MSKDVCSEKLYASEIFDEIASKLHKKQKKHKKKKRRKQLQNYIVCECYPEASDNPYADESPPEAYESQPESEQEFIPPQLNLNKHGNHGVSFGKLGQIQIGLPQDQEGNIAAVGSAGSAKTTSVANTTLASYTGAMCVTDIKGELSEFYKKLYDTGIVTRPYLVFNPMDSDSIGFDPFYWLNYDDRDNLVSNMWEIILALIPTPTGVNDPFWVESEQALLMATLLYYFDLKTDFIEAIIAIVSSNLSDLCQKILESNNDVAKMYIGQVFSKDSNAAPAFERGIRNKLMLFATDIRIQRAFSKKQNGTHCFSWNELDKYNIFIRIPEDKIDEWSGAINLMYTQLIKHLMRRPDKYSPEGAENIQTLLLFDEFARFGKLEIIPSAIATLRSKNVNIFLIIQSLAQLDKIYGENDRRIILDNCQYQAFLRSNEAVTQKYISEIIGTKITIQKSAGESMDEDMDTVGYSKRISEIREFIVFPHELSTMQDVLLLSPYGFFRLKKFQMFNDSLPQKLETEKFLFSQPLEGELQADDNNLFLR